MGRDVGVSEGLAGIGVGVEAGRNRLQAREKMVNARIKITRRRIPGLLISNP
jgi:hypothetical protein